MTSDSPSPNSAGADAPAIDRAALAQLEQLDPTGTAGIVRRVLETYLLSLSRMLGELAPALGAQEWATVGRVAHTLRSSSASVGALILSEHCRLAEMAVRESRWADATAAAQALQNESVRVELAVKAMLAPRETPGL